MIQELIKAKVLSMNANGLTYSFLHSEPEWQNIVADNATLPAVYMDMPVQFTPVVKTGGGYERRYVATCLFLFKSNLDDNETQRYDSLKLAETAQRQFHLMLNQDPINFKDLEVSQCYQVQNLFDCNLDGVVMPFTFTERNTNSVCVPSSAPSGVVTVQLNSQTFLSIDCGNTQNITLTDVLGNELTGYEVVGSNIKIKNSVVTNSIDDVLADLAPQENIELSDVDNIDSDGSTVPTPAGVPFTCTPVAPCEDATAVLKDTALTTISTTPIASGASADITAPDATYTVQYEDTTPITSGSIVSGGSALIEVPNPIVCEDAVAVLKDEDGNTLSTTDIPSGDTIGITAPNGSYTVEYVNGTLIESGSVLSGGSVTVEVPNPIVCEDATLTLNTGAFLTVASGSNTDISLVDQDDVDITPISVVGDVIKVNIPSGSSVGATLTKTGQTTSYYTGDDGDLQSGRAVDFFTLDGLNPFGTSNRFTNIFGVASGYYLDEWIIDWTTFNGSTVLGYAGKFQTLGTYSFDDAIDFCNSYALEGFTGRAPNTKELYNLINLSTQGMNYLPFYIGFGVNAWSSNSLHLSNTHGYFLSIGDSILTYDIKTNLKNVLPVRDFTVTGTTLT